jgi:hypothetical protein
MGRAIVQVLRRGHLYAGLLMLPWVILYGVTAFLFNHPTAFSDQPTSSFNEHTLRTTPMAEVPTPADEASRVVAALRSQFPQQPRYELIHPEKARYTREFAFATVRSGETEVSVLLDVRGKGGTVRSRTVPSTPEPTTKHKAPFAIGGAALASSSPPKGGRNRSGPPSNEIPTKPLVENPLHARVEASIPTILEQTGFPSGTVQVTSVPDLSFHMSDGEQEWIVTYNSLRGSVTGTTISEEPTGEGLSARRFLLRLHTAHGYPGDWNAKWVWAVIVDVMAGIMVFWGLSGILMWWQIKATRILGLGILVLSAVFAIWIGMGMHELMTTTGAR